jgi:hypothetical protein
MPPGNPGGMTMEQSRWNEEQDLKEVQTSEQGHAHLQVICCHSLHEDCLQGEQEICRGNLNLKAEPAWSNAGLAPGKAREST